MAINLKLETFGAQFNAFVDFAKENAANGDTLACIGGDGLLDPAGKPIGRTDVRGSAQIRPDKPQGVEFPDNVLVRRRRHPAHPLRIRLRRTPAYV